MKPEVLYTYRQGTARPHAKHPVFFVFFRDVSPFFFDYFVKLLALHVVTSCLFSYFSATLVHWWLMLRYDYVGFLQLCRDP